MSSKVCMILVWFFVICLLVVGLVMVSSTAAWAEETKHPYEPLFKQTAFACAGLVGAMILSRIDYRIWRKYIWWILGGACFLLVLCYVPGIGKEINGERRWITIGMQFQPSECAKLCMMMALANWLALYRDRTTSFWWGFVMPGLIFGIPLALILFEKDMGTSVALALLSPALHPYTKRQKNGKLAHARWKDLQLPVYVLWASETYGGHPSAAYYALPANPMDIGISSWDSLHDTMPGYEECALDSARSWTVELMKLLHEGRGLITAEELGWTPPSYDVFKDLMTSRRESLQDLLGLRLTPHLPF